MKMLTIGLIAVIAVGGVVIGLGYSGVLKIRGITPDKPKQSASTPNQQPQTNIAAQPSAVTAVQQQPSPQANVEKPAEVTPRKDGTERLSKLWSSMDADVLKKILMKWDEADTLPVLAKMDDDKLAALLAAIAVDDPDKAARISKGIRAMEKGGK